MSESSRALALELPLKGSRLIEASAGTGKTYTIALLYVRLLLGHGREAFGNPLLPPQILVVTFTDAATAELRERIRSRLVEAAEVFAQNQTGDELLKQLRDDYPPEQWPDCAQRLRLGAQWMDEAAVSTIHGFCQRMLREHAFASGSLFTQRLETDHSELLAEVVRDYWRQHCYPLQGKTLEWVIEQWRSPDQLAGQLKPWLKLPAAASSQSLLQCLEQAFSERRAALEALKAPWRQWVDGLQALIEQARAQKAFHGGKLKQPDSQRWFEQIRQWANGDEESLDLKKGFERLTPEGLQEAWKEGPVPEHPALLAMRDLPEKLAQLPDPAELALRHAASRVREDFAEQKRKRAEMGFDDMLAQLDQALQRAEGPRLAELIRQQFPVALIDEFQDTDPLQYRIFDTIYQVENNREDCALLLIGDPKQAIYSFRGADIETYLKARQATAGRHYHLQRNFRSTQGMVEAVNDLFELGQDSPQGAFLQGQQLPFTRVQAQGKSDTWQVDGATPKALTIWHLPSDEPLKRDQYAEVMAESCASEIVRLLNLGEQNRAGFAERALHPGDIAILVRNFQEAQLIGQALSQRGVRSVYLSDKDSVLASAEAQDLLRWLRACAAPEDDRLLRAALACATLALPLAELERLNQDERYWEARVMQFRALHSRWQRQGVLPMVRQLLHEFALAKRLLALPDGERRLTNLLHLAELLQQAGAELDGELALIRHFEEQIAAGESGRDEQIVRLESDEALLKIVTIHKSKGLEYPLVFLPFVAAFRPTDGKKPLARITQGQYQVRLKADTQTLQEADQQRLAEDLRLLYVALTRAKYACWLGVADLRIGNSKESCFAGSALGYLLGGGQALESPAQLKEWLDRLNSEHCTLAPPPLNTDERYQPALADTPKLEWKVPQRRASEHWWIASYSALQIDEHSPLRREQASDAWLPVAARDEEALFNSEQVPPSATPGLHSFKRGPEFGTFLHGLLQFLAEEGFARALQEPVWLSRQIATRCARRQLDEWAEPLTEWLKSLLAEPLRLPNGTPSLVQLTHYHSEMEFWFSAQQVDVEQLDQLVRREEQPQWARKALRPDRLNGLFKGFIDLCFEHQGRFYLLDYKSNWLGEDDSAYQPHSLAEQIALHRYDLQYLLYSLALHRQLRLRLTDYDYDQHFGGVLYLFMRAPAVGQYFSKPKRALIEQLDALFQGQEVAL